MVLLFMIKSFKDSQTDMVWKGVRSRRLPSEIQDTAKRKIRLINNAHTLADLRIPPANRLEALKHDREGQHSIRINDLWRVCFVWLDGDAGNVEITDYH